MDFFNRRNPDGNRPEAEEENTPSPPVTEDTEADEPDAAYAEPAVTRDVAARMFDTALGAGSNLEGTLHSDGNVRLDGRFKGALDITENVLIGETADIEADVNAKNITVAGHIRGNVTGKKIHLLATARIIGDISAEALITEDGAVIEGRVSMSNEETITLNLSSPPADRGTIQ
ncbi:MAG: polymer-forming cytoskeletal protein [Chloroflexota bacterium]